MNYIFFVFHRFFLLNLQNMDINDILDMIDVDDDDSDTSEDDVIGLLSMLQRNKQPKNAASLKSLSIMSIAENITFWKSFLPENANDFLYCISPFDVLSTLDTLAIMKILVHRKAFRHEHFQLFLHYKLTSLDFSILSKHVVTDNAFKLLFNRCKRIKNLTIPSARLSLKTLNQIPVVYPGLEYLRVYREVCQYKFIDLLATHCRKLKLLMIEVCANIPDNTFERIKECTSLNSLSLYHAENMTCSTLQKIMEPLKCLNQLSLVGCKMNFAPFNGNNIEYESLTSIDLSWSNVTDDGLKQIVSHMKNIAEIYLSRCQNLTTLAFKSIANLESLGRLAIGYFTRNYEFDMNVEFCLLRVGMNLQYLDLSGMPHIQPSIISICCPNLKTLYMNHCLYPSIDWLRLNNENCEKSQYNWLSNTKGLFSLLGVCRCLEQLSISCMHLSYDDVGKIFFTSSTLKKLKFLPWPNDTSKHVSEQFFIDFLNDFYFENLVELDVSRNDGLTKKVVLIILQLYPNLKRLSISSCDLVTQELSAIREIVINAGLDIVIEVSCDRNMVTLL